MEKSSIKSCLKKIIIGLFILFFSGYAALWLYLAVYTDNIKNIISQALTDSLGSKIIIGDLKIGCTGRVKIRDFIVYATRQGKKLIFRTEAISLKVKLWPLLKKRIALKSLVIEESRVIEKTEALFNFVRDQRDRMTELVKRLRAESDNSSFLWSVSGFIPVVEFRSHIVYKTDFIKKGVFWLTLRLEQNKKGGYNGRGIFEVQEIKLENKSLEKLISSLVCPWPVYYDFSGQINSKAIELTKFKIKHKNIRCAIGGKIDWTNGRPEYDLRLATNKLNLKKIFKNNKDIKYNGTIEIKGLISGPLLKPDPRILVELNKISISSLTGDFYANYFSEKIRYVKGFLSLEDLKGFIVDVPVSIVGFINSPFSGPQMDITLRSYPDQPAGALPPKAVRFKTKITTQCTAEGLKADLNNEIYKLEKNIRQTYYVILKGLLFKDLSCLEMFFNKKISFPFKADLLTIGPGKSLTSVENLQFIVARQNGRIAIENISSTAYQGQLNAFIINDMTESGLKISAHIGIKDIVLEEWLKDLGIKYNISGLLNGRSDLFFDTEFHGNCWLRASKGRVSELPFLVSLAQTTGISPLKDIEFDNIVIDYYFSEKEKNIKNFRLESKQADIRGKSRFRTDGWMNGEISSRFAKDSLERSSKLRLAVRILGDRCKELDFNFCVFGDVNSPRFRWMPSNFKENLQELIGPGRARKLDRSIDKLTNSLK